MAPLQAVVPGCHSDDTCQDATTVSMLIRAFAPLPSTLSLSFTRSASINDVLATIGRRFSSSSSVPQMLRLTTVAGRPVVQCSTVNDLLRQYEQGGAASTSKAPINLELRASFLGGKGGFGSMLRAQGGKMSSNRRGEENNDACRDLNGRRLSTIKQARQLATYLASKEEREREMSEVQRKKYAKLEKILGRKPRGEEDFVEAATKLDEKGETFDQNGSEEDGGDDQDGPASLSAAGPSSRPIQSRAGAQERGRNKNDSAPFAGSKRDRIEDAEYLEQSRTIVTNVRSAVASAMLKKKRKVANGTAKTGHVDKSPSSVSSAPSTAGNFQAAQEV